jgi:hypothetical protein
VILKRDKQTAGTRNKPRKATKIAGETGSVESEWLRNVFGI